ncbi:hypothetical protein Z946_2479 [Sulfitobacter noctilucicola]|nr:hypothetical protein Z946_2479 [Sulfitobacter noctilucicola]
MAKFNMPPSQKLPFVRDAAFRRDQMTAMRDKTDLDCKCANIRFGEPFNKRWNFVIY